LLAVLASTVLLAGCGGDSSPPKIRFGSAKPSGGKLGLHPGGNSQLPLAQWPDACRLLSDSELRAIVPQAKHVKRKPVKVTILNTDPLSEAPPGTTGDVPRGGCEFEFALPDSGGEGTGNSNVSITVSALADPALVAKRYGEDKRKDRSEKGFTDLGDSWGVDGCYLVGDGLSAQSAECRQGPYLFDAGGSSWAEGVAPKPGPDANADENRAAERKRNRTWTDKVVAQAVRTVGARMS